MHADLELTEIWQSSTLAAGCIADAIFARRDDPKADVAKDLDEAAKRMSKAAIEIRQFLSTHRR